MTRPSPAERFEGVMQILILLGIGAVSAAASFTHIHDWTMANSPSGTGDWFGWANAVVSDLVPVGVGLEVRRRRRHGLSIGAYPIIIILAAAALSLAGQLAQARPSITGWLLAAVPALGFLSLTKLVLSRPTVPEPLAVVKEPHPMPEPARLTVYPTRSSTVESIPDDLIPGARIVADAYRRATGHHITGEARAERLQVPVNIAARLLEGLTGSEPTTPARLHTTTSLEAVA